MASSFFLDFTKLLQSRITIILAGVLSAIITARLLGPAGSGQLAGILVYPSLFMSLGSLGVRQASTFMLGKGLASEEDLRLAILNVWLITSVIGVLASYILISTMSLKLSFVDTLLAVAAIPFSLYVTYISGIYLGQNKIREFSRVDWIPSLIILAGNIVLVMLLRYGVTGALIAHLLGPITIFVIVWCRRPVSLSGYRLDYKLIWRLLKLGSVFAVTILVINLNYRLDIILLENLSSQYELGIYSKGANITQYMWQVPMLLSTLVFARGSNAVDPHEFSLKVARLLRVSFLALCGCAVFLFFVADVVVAILYGSQFAGSAETIRILLPGVVIIVFFKVMNMDLAGRGKPWLALGAMVPALLINVILNYILIPDFGANGAALASTISYAIGGVLFIIIYARATAIPLRVIFSFHKSDYSFILERLKR